MITQTVCFKFAPQLIHNFKINKHKYKIALLFHFKFSFKIFKFLLTNKTYIQILHFSNFKYNKPLNNYLVSLIFIHLLHYFSQYLLPTYCLQSEVLLAWLGTLLVDQIVIWSQNCVTFHIGFSNFHNVVLIIIIGMKFLFLYLDLRKLI